MHPLLAAFLAVVFWGVSFVASKAVLATLSPTVLIFTRFALGALVLLAISAARKQPLIPPRNTWPMLALMGFIGVFVHQMLQLHGLVHTTAVNAGWLVGLVPIWSAILAVLFLRERFGPFKLAGLALGFAGATLVVTHGQISTETLALPSTLGDILVLASTLNWAVYTIVGRRTIQRLGSLQATSEAMFLGWLMLIPFFLHSAGWRELPALDATGWLYVLFLGICCSGLAYLFWYRALEFVAISGDHDAPRQYSALAQVDRYPATYRRSGSDPAVIFPQWRWSQGPGGDTLCHPEGRRARAKGKDLQSGWASGSETEPVDDR